MQKCVFCPIAQNFLLVSPLLPAYNFSATLASIPIALVVWELWHPENFRRSKICLELYDTVKCVVD